jgi:hypothetical protein
MVYYRKNRKSSRRNKSRRNTTVSMRKRRNNINMMGGEYSMPSPVGDTSMKGPMQMSMGQGQQFADYHKNQHGGVLAGGPYPGVVTEESLISADMALSARTAPLNAALNEIRNMNDQAGGKRKRRNTTMRKNRNNRKNRKNNMSMRKRKNNNMSMRKRRNNNMSMRKRRTNRRNNTMMGGAVLSPALTSSPGLLLSSGMEAKAVSGMNAEWKLAENPRSFAPGL